VAVALAALSVIGLSGCGPLGAAPSLDPSAPCGGAEEQRMAGFHPDLEALLPTTIDGVALRQLESGRYCSERALGLLAAAGFTEVDFAGATWSDDDETGLAIAVYRAPGLTLDAVADSFARGADDARSVNQVHATPLEIEGRPAVRIDAIMRETPQSVYLWPADQPDLILAVIGSGVDEAELDAALAAMRGR
jgi:hypothetical protein